VDAEVTLPRAGVIRVLIADDQTVVREGLATLLAAMEGVEVVASARDGEETVRLAALRRPDVVLMDLRMPRCDGVEATRRLSAEQPEVKVVVLTTYADDSSVFGALEAGARGYLTKDAGAAEIAHAIRTVHAGEALLDPSVQRRLLETLRVASTAAAPPLVETPPDGLTQCEAEVLGLIADGLSSQDIAASLHVSETTVKTHINNLFSKTGVRDRAQAVRYAYGHGLAHLHP